MQSSSRTVSDYLAELPPERRAALVAVQAVIAQNLDPDYEEGMQYGMIGYYVPHRVFPPGYHCDPRQPLPFAGLASQKNYMSLYLMATYGDEGEQQWLRTAWAQAGKKLDMGKSCIRFKKLDDIPYALIGQLMRKMSVKDWIGLYERQLLPPAKKK